MGEFLPFILTAIAIAAVATMVALIAGGAIYILTQPLILIPLLAIIGFFIWRGYKRRRV